jgi:hypothetical protein
LRGIPEHETAFIHDADAETKKKALFARVHQGKIRALFGSTFKMSTGANAQDARSRSMTAIARGNPQTLRKVPGIMSANVLSRHRAPT